MKLRTAAAAALSPFAHLAGLGPRRAAAPKAEDDKPKEESEAEEEEEEDKASDTSAEGDEKDKDAGKGKGGSAEDDADADGDEGEGDPDEEDPDEEMRGSSAAAQARRRERARCAAIFASPHAAGRADVAAQLAFRTSMPRSAAIESLAALARADGGGGRRRRPGLDERMEDADNPRLSPGGGEKSGAAQVASSWDAAFKRAAG